jgi:purine catabolism regulator
MVETANRCAIDPQDMPSVTYGVPLRELLAMESLARADVLAGESGLDHPVARVQVIDDRLDVASLRADELLLAPAAALSPLTAQTYVDLVRDLSAAGCAGLVLTPADDAGELPADALAAADDLGIPLLALAGERAFESVLTEVYARLSNVQARVLERIDALHSALTLVVLEGGDLAEIAEEVARVLSVSVIFTSTDGRERAAAISPADRARLVDVELFDVGSGRFRVERVRLAPVHVGAGEIRLLPVVAGGSALARMVVYSRTRVLTPSDGYALERAAMVAALFLTRQLAVNAVEAKYRGDFLREVFGGRAGDDERVIEHASTLGWDVDRPMAVVVSELDPTPPDEQPVAAQVRRGWQDRFAAAWGQVVEARDPTIAVVDFSVEVVALVPVPAAAAPGREREELRGVVDALLDGIRGDRGGGRRSFSAGISRIVERPSQLPEAYRHAQRAVQVGRRIHGDGETTSFDSLGVHRLLSLVPDREELQAFAAETLRGLAADSDAAADLRTTLQVLLDTNLNVAEAARLQHFHYNTMRYRVTKLESHVGPFTSDPHLRLDLAVALQVHGMNG